MTSKRWLIGLSALVGMLTVAGAVSFVRYARRHRPDPQLAAIAPFDIFVPGLEPWRVRLAEGLTKQLDSMPPLAAVSQDVVRERWRGQGRPELAALELARGTSAGLAIYGRIDPIPTSRDSVCWPSADVGARGSPSRATASTKRSSLMKILGVGASSADSVRDAPMTKVGVRREALTTRVFPRG